MKTCANCGLENEENELYCISCGMPLEADDALVDEEDQLLEEDKKDPVSLALIIGGALILIISLVVLLMTFK